MKEKQKKKKNNHYEHRKLLKELINPDRVDILLTVIM